MKYIVLIILSCWIVSSAITSCQKKYHEQKHVTHVTVKKSIDYQLPPITLTPEDIKEMNEFEDAEIDDVNQVNMDICFIKCAI